MTPISRRGFLQASVVHTDMHNYSLFSDGAGDPAAFYESMRTSGIDAASLTDHSTLSDLLVESPCTVFEPLSSEAHSGCLGVAGLTERTWAETRALADQHDQDGDFSAIAGFEWSSPTLGHMNVWYSREFTDPAHTGGLGDPDDLAAFAAGEGFPLPQEVIDGLRSLVEQTPMAGIGMQRWYDWLKADPDAAILGGGADAIFGFNHPGREAGRFGEFVLDSDLVKRCVSMELFNKGQDYLFERVAEGRPSPLIACLDAGWHPGILGTSDYHGTDWGTPDERGRAGMYVQSLSRATIREAMEARRFFATRVKGLRFDAAANGARMGTTLGHTDGVIRLAVDLDRGPGWVGKPLQVQVLTTGALTPTVLDNREAAIRAPTEPVIEFEVPVDVEDTRWLVLRGTDPEQEADGSPPDDTWAGFGRSIAYGSPVYLDPDRPTPGPTSPPGTSQAPDGRQGPGPSGPSLQSTGSGQLTAVTGLPSLPASWRCGTVDLAATRTSDKSSPLVGPPRQLTGRAQRFDDAVLAAWPAGVAHAAAVVDQQVGDLEPALPRKQTHEVLLDLLDIRQLGEPQSTRQTVHVSVHDDADVVAETVRQHDVGGLAGHTRQGGQLLHGPRDLAAMAFEDERGGGLQVLGLLPEQTERVDEPLDLLDRCRGECLRVRESLEQARRDLVDLDVGGLRRQDRGHEQFPAVAEPQRDVGVRVFLREQVEDDRSAFRLAGIGGEVGRDLHERRRLVTSAWPGRERQPPAMCVKRTG